MSAGVLTVVVAAFTLTWPSTSSARASVALPATAVVEVSQQVPRIRVGGGIAGPRKLKHVEPLYPDDAKAAGVEGAVILEILIDTKGLVAETRVVESISLLDAAAVTAVRQWVYTPTLLNGEPCEVLMTVTVNFRLKNS